MKVTLNGKERTHRDGASLVHVVAELSAAPNGIAVALNGTVVPRGSWADTTLTDGDNVEVLTAVQGG